MSRPVVSSDLHLGHKNITKYRTMFKTSEEHDDAVIAAHKETLRKNDTWYCFGDCAFTKAALARIKELKCRRKVLFLGNHCLENEVTMEDLLEVFDKVYSLQPHKCFGVKMWFSHCPIHPDEMRGKDFNVHGHTHDYSIDDYRYVNVCVEHTNWGVVPLQGVIEKFKEDRDLYLSTSWFKRFGYNIKLIFNKYMRAH